MSKVLYLCTMLMLATAIMSGSCHKSSGGSNEATLSVELNPAANSVQSPSPGPDFPLVVTIKSTMPPSGVKIDVSATEDVANSTPFFTTSVNSTTATNNFNITGTPRTITAKVTVTVTSLTDANNKWTGSYTYSRK